MPEPTRLERPAAAAEAQFGRAGRTLTPEQQQNWEAGQRIRAKRAENTGEQSVLESFVPHPPPTEARVRHVNNENIGTTRKGGAGPDAGEKKYTGRGEQRSREFREKADRFAGLSRELLDKGYDKLEDSPGFTADQKKELLRNEILEASKSWPLAKAVLESYGAYGDAAADTARRELMEEMLKDPKFLKQLSGHFGEIYDGDGAFLKEIVAEAQEEFEKARVKKEAKEKELAEVDAALVPVDAKYVSFQPGGPDFTRFNALETASGTWATDIRTASNEITRLQNEIRGLATRQYSKRTVIDYDPATGNRIGTHEEVTEDLAISGRITTAQGELNTYQSLADSIQSDQDALNALREERDKVSQRRTELREKQAQLGGELGELDAEFISAEAQFNAQKALRRAEEEEFVNKIQGMVREAGRRHVKEDAKMNEAAQKKLAERGVTDAKDRDEKQLQTCMNENWRRTKMVGVVRTRSVEEVDKDEVRATYERAIRERGMDWYVRNSMETHLRTLAPGSPEFAEERRRLDERFRDTDFMKKMNATAMERLFKNYLESGNKLKKEDVSILTETEGGLGAVDRALEANKAVSTAIEKLKGQKGFTGSNREFIMRVAKDKKTHGILAGLLALAFASPFLIAGGTVAGALYEKGVEAAFTGSGAALDALG